MSWPALAPLLLLSVSNVFMTFAWYGQLKYPNTPLLILIPVSSTNGISARTDCR